MGLDGGSGLVGVWMEVSRRVWVWMEGVDWLGFGWR